ncbi:MAG TPA: hypothetical protein VMI94_29135 [Bryobacteraceae bacterium]|nr:hypothetical protein [Bryobacteraceae bacterium]
MLQLITILNRCHRFPGFVYHQARFTSDHRSIEIAVRPRKGSQAVCSRCHQPGPGYDYLAERRFEFIPFWGFLVFLVYCMRRVDCRRCQAVVVEEVLWAAGKRTLTRAYMPPRVIYHHRWSSGGMARNPHSRFLLTILGGGCRPGRASRRKPHSHSRHRCRLYWLPARC